MDESRNVITMEEYLQGGYLTLSEFAKARGRAISGIRGLAFRGTLPILRVLGGPLGVFRVVTTETALKFEFPRQGRPPMSVTLLKQAADAIKNGSK